MTKQEFLAMSLPYELLLFQENMSGGIIRKLTGINVHYNYVTFNDDISSYSWSYFKGVTPILHPLSDLTKEIKHNGEKFVPIIELIKIKYSILLDLQNEEFSIYTDGYPRACYTTNAIWEIMINPYYLSNEEFWIIQKLIEWHFDISYFIPNGEAIDVNTLETNPYK